jgi:hypothetical protein
MIGRVIHQIAHAYAKASESHRTIEPELICTPGGMLRYVSVIALAWAGVVVFAPIVLPALAISRGYRRARLLARMAELSKTNHG